MVAAKLSFSRLLLPFFSTFSHSLLVCDVFVLPTGNGYVTLSCRLHVDGALVAYWLAVLSCRRLLLSRHSLAGIADPTPAALGSLHAYCLVPFQRVFGASCLAA